MRLIVNATAFDAVTQFISGSTGWEGVERKRGEVIYSMNVVVPDNPALNSNTCHI